jgi:hypothetical protein
MKIRFFLLALAILSSAPPAMAGPFSDDLSRCLVSSTTPHDRTSLVRWLFAAMAQHPAVASLATVSGADVEAANAEAGALFMKLLTESCRDRTKAALKYEGPAAIQLSFQVLGQAAAGEIFANPKVASVLAGLKKYADSKKLEALKEQ